MNLDLCGLRGVESCSENDSALEVSRTLRDKKTRYLVVLEGEVPKGIISVTDINNRVVAEGKNPEKTKAKDIMTKSLMVKEVGEDLTQVYLEMLKRNIYSCVVTKKGNVLGMLDLKEAMNCIVKEKNKNGKGKN